MKQRCIYFPVHKSIDIENNIHPHISNFVLPHLLFVLSTSHAQTSLLDLLLTLCASKCQCCFSIRYNPICTMSGETIFSPYRHKL